MDKTLTIRLDGPQGEALTRKPVTHRKTEKQTCQSLPESMPIAVMLNWQVDSTSKVKSKK